MSTEISTILMDKVADWLTQSSLAGNDLETLVEGFCERLAAAGLPIKRVHLSFSMLHPLYDALGFTWDRGRRHERRRLPQQARRPSGAASCAAHTIICSATISTICAAASTSRCRPNFLSSTTSRNWASPTTSAFIHNFEIGNTARA